MLDGGGTVLLQGNSRWNAPGGGTASVDPSTDESLLVFHAQNIAQGGVPFVWVNRLNWVNEWPEIGN